jgi:hypothetical protein
MMHEIGVRQEAAVRVRERATNNDGNNHGMRSISERLSPAMYGIEIIRHDEFFVKKTAGRLDARQRLDRAGPLGSARS